MAILGVTAVLAALALVIGFPFAAWARDARGGWLSLGAESLIWGTIVGCFAVTAWAWLGVAGIVIAAVLWLGAVVAAVFARNGLPARPARPSSPLLLAASLALAVVAVVLRLHNVNFVPWIGDMGAYVNWANEFVRTGSFGATWPPVFSSYLAVSTALFGSAFTTAGLPFAGLVLIIAIALLVSRIPAGKWVVFATALVAATGVHFVWFASFPASESLDAPVFVGWLLTVQALLKTSGRARVPWVVLSFITMTCLTLLRGTGALLLVPVIVLFVLTLLVPSWRAAARNVWWVLASGIAASLIGFWYGIAVIPKYFVLTQIPTIVPASAMRVLTNVGAFTPSVATGVVLVVASAAVVAAAFLLARTAQRTTVATPSRLPFVLAIAVGSLLALGVIVDIAVNAEVVGILWRAGFWLPVVGIALFFLIRALRVDDATLWFALLLGMTLGMFLVVHTLRLKLARAHDFYLYWDRYLFSEAIPILLILSAIAFHFAWLRFAPLVAGSERLPAAVRSAAPAAVAAVLVAATVVVAIPTQAMIASNTYLDGAYELDAKLAAIATDGTPVVWSGTSEATLANFSFPNTWMAVGVPLRRSFGVNVLNADQGSPNFAPDDVVDASYLANEFACGIGSTLLVFELDTSGARLDERIAGNDSGISAVFDQQVVVDVAQLTEPPRNGWQKAHFAVDVWRVSTSDATRGTCQNG